MDNSSSPSRTPDRKTSSSSQSSDLSRQVRGKASEAMSAATEAAQQAGSQAKEAVRSLASEANQQTKGYLTGQVSAGADLARHFADSIKCAADNLEPKAPQLARLVRGAADRVQDVSSGMRGKSADDLIQGASDFTRRQPAVVFGLASLAGFFLFRVLKAKPSESADNYRSFGSAGSGGPRGSGKPGQPAASRPMNEGSGQFHGI